MVDIFENPTMKELKDIGGDIRFIADATNKKYWIWDAMTAVHLDMWKGVIKDPRNLYKSGDIVTGELSHNHKTILIDAFYNLPQSIRQEIQSQDWTFVKLFDLDNRIKGAGK